MRWIQKDIKKEFNTKKDSYIKNLEEGARKIIEHIEKGSRIACYFDYDPDGIGCAYITNWVFKKLNYPINIKIPNRVEGYGISKKWILDNKDNFDLIFTGDNGASKNEEVDLIKSLEIDVLITDHHLSSGENPSCLFINPHYGSSEFTRELCGAGVIFYLMRELISQLDVDIDIMEVSDFLTISTVADLVNLDGANRAIVTQGLKRINRGDFSSEGIKLLFSKFNKVVTSEDIAFGVAPIINAVSRIDDVNRIFKFLNDENEENLSDMVDLNAKRKDMQHQYFIKALKEIDESKNIIIYKNDYIEKGLVGLCAGDLSNHFNKPCLVFSKGHFSGRSINDIDLHAIIKNNEELLDGWGGHKFANAGGLKKDEK